MTTQTPPNTTPSRPTPAPEHHPRGSWANITLLLVEVGLFALTLLAFSLLLTGCGEEEAPEPAPRPVRVAEAVPAGAGATRAFSGQTQAPVEARLSFRVGGAVVRLPVEVGKRLRAGALVGTLDPQDYRIRVREAEAARIQARAQARSAEAEYERVQTLYAEDLVSLSAFDRARAQHETAQALVEAAEERLRLAQQQLAYTRLDAPTGGSVAEVLVEPGENVQPGQPVVALASDGPLEVEVVVPEDVVGRLGVGEEAVVTLAAYPSARLSAVVAEVGVAPRRGGTAFPVVLELQNAPEEARPGMAARAAFVIDAAGEAAAGVLVPPEAVTEDVNGRFVYAVEHGAEAAPEPYGPADRPASRADGVVQRRPVEVGRLTPAGLLVTSGLAPGALVVSAGVGQVRPGQRVRIAPAAPAGPRPGGPLALDHPDATR